MQCMHARGMVGSAVSCGSVTAGPRSRTAGGCSTSPSRGLRPCPEPGWHCSRRSLYCLFQCTWLKGKVERASLQMVQNREERLIRQVVVLPFRAACQGINFNRGKCTVLPLGMNNLKHQYTEGTDWLESSPAETDLETLVDNKLTRTHQCTLRAKVNSILSFVRRVLLAGCGRWSFLTIQHCWGRVCSTLSKSGLPSQWRMWTYWRRPSVRPQR